MPSRTKTIQHLAATFAKKPGIRFSKDEIEKLLKFYKQQLERDSDKPSERMDRARFRDLLHSFFHITDDIIMDRVFKAFDQDNDSAVSMEEWLRGLSVYLRGTLDERIKFCFTVYDMHNDGHISREEMFQLLKTSLVKASIEEEPDESIKELVEITMRKVDSDSDGRVSLEDYRKSVSEDSLLLELLGQCLPNDEHKACFMEQVQNS